jgi:PhzF family phenazine biosynthesis protein
VRYLQVDVFTEVRGGGNPLGVVVDADGMSSHDMQAFAAWTNLVETTFLLPPTDARASYNVRIFTPSKEIPFAGHPTLGSAHAALQCGVAEPVDGALIQQCQIGLLPVRIIGKELFVRAPKSRIVKEGFNAHPLLARALRGAVAGSTPPCFVEGGRKWWVAELKDEANLRAWTPDHVSIAALAQASDSLGLCVYAPVLGQHFDFAVRAFPAGVGIVEDPASGAANGLIAAVIKARKLAGLESGYRVSQGREIGHDASILIRFVDDEVWVGGQVKTVIEGTAHWSHSTSKSFG